MNENVDVTDVLQSTVVRELKFHFSRKQLIVKRRKTKKIAEY